MTHPALVIAIALFVPCFAFAQPTTLEQRIDELEQALDDEREARLHYQRAEVQFLDRAITIDHELDLERDPLIAGSSGDATRVKIRNKWFAYVGSDTDARLEPTDFYRLMDRPDLARSYGRRRTAGIALTAGGLGAAIVGSLMIAGSDQSSNLRVGGLTTVAGGAIAACFGLYYLRYTHPVSETEARDLASEYNARLRATLHQPSRASRARVMPYVAGDGAGLALGGAF
ncbi:MAG: hypothetical protein AB7P03_05870 [Kofleriaceae bacterium]